MGEMDKFPPMEVSKHSPRPPPFFACVRFKPISTSSKTDVASSGDLPRPRIPSKFPFGDFRMAFVFVSSFRRIHII